MVNKSNRILDYFLFFIIFLNLHCGFSENSNNDNKYSTMYKIICHEDLWVAKVEKVKDKIFASSTLEQKNNNYTIHNLFDGKKETCWCPEGNGIGEFIIFKIPYGIKGIKLTNGLAATDELFKNNNRVKDLYVGIIADLYYPEKGLEEYDLCGKRKYKLNNVTYKYYNISLQDISKPQNVILYITKDYEGKPDKLWEFIDFKRSKVLYLVIGIESIYKGNKYNDTCISEIELY